jgi:hypothetical protein
LKKVKKPLTNPKERDIIKTPRGKENTIMAADFARLNAETFAAKNGQYPSPTRYK